MKTIIFSSLMLIQACALILTPVAGLGMGGEPQASQVGSSDPVASAQADMRQAAGELHEAAAEFGAGNAAGAQNSAATTWSQATNPAAAQNGQNAQDARAQALQGSPATGYAGTWTDPATGDVMTSVIAPAPQTPQNQSYPIIVEPQIGGYGYQGGQSWGQWPTSPDNPGYPPSGSFNQNLPYNQPPPPGWHAPYPGQPYPGFNPYPYQGPLGWQPYPGYYPSQNGAWVPGQAGQAPPAYPSAPPPFPPGYRPLRPAPPPVQNNPGGIWQPGSGPGMPGVAPGVAPLPLRPSGNTWQNSQPAPARGGLFGRGPGGF